MEVIEVGFFALRNPDGSFGDPVPLYAEATPEMQEAEREMISGLGREFARIYNAQKMADVAAE